MKLRETTSNGMEMEGRRKGRAGMGKKGTAGLERRSVVGMERRGHTRFLPRLLPSSVSY